jgi:hypothetical protein
MPLSDYSMDKFIAPDVSKFTRATIRDMSTIDSEQDHWQQNFILNTMLRAEVSAPQRQQLINFLRRCHSSFDEYSLARKSTLAFVLDRNLVVTYLDAIGHWEAYLAYSWQACCFLGGGTPKWFKQNDGSVPERPHALHSRAKHADRAIRDGNFNDGDAPLCVWLTNDGLRNSETSLTFEEMAVFLEDLAQLASVVQDPLTMSEKLKSLVEKKD